MNVNLPLALLGGLTPAQFMRRHWQKKPLLVRQAWPGVVPPVTRTGLFELAAQDGVESRLVRQGKTGWQLRHGPFNRRQLPGLNQPDWTLLVQGLDLHVPQAHAMLAPFRFVPDACMDDLMLSYATPGGGVGPHLDSYDVFLLQVQGRRRWRIGPVPDRSLVDGLPVRILANFQPDQEWVLEPGDMLYLPPLWGHDGVAEDECMTCSIGFRAPTATQLGQDLLQRLAEDLESPPPGAAEPIYRDKRQSATDTPARLPPSLRDFASRALARALSDPQALDRILGQISTEPKPQVWFEAGKAQDVAHAAGLRLDRRTRMAYDDHHLFINGEAFEARGRDARLVRQLADQRHLSAKQVAALSAGAQALLADWCAAGWVRPEGDAPVRNGHQADAG